MDILKKSGLAIGVALAVSASGTMAAGTFVQGTSESVSVEAASTGSYTADVTGGQFVLQPGNAYPVGAGARLTITLDNGATFADSTYVLEESGAGGSTASWTLTTGVGTSSLEFVLDASGSTAEDEFILSGSTAVGQAISVNVPAAAAGSEINIDAEYKDSPTTVFESYNDVELFQYFNEFSAAVTTSANGIVDVADDRLSFTGGVDNDVIAFTYTDAALNNKVALTDDDKVEITLSGDMSGIDAIAAVTDGASRGDMTIDTATNTATISLSASDVFAGAGLTQLTATVDGTSTLATRTFTSQTDLNFVDETDKNLIAENTSVGEWTINGLQAKVSHLSLNTTGFVSWLKVVNEGNTDAEISADIIWTLADGTEGSVSGATLGSVDAGGIATIGEAALLTAMGNPTQLADVSMIVTVAGQTNAIHLVAEKKASDGRLPIPVYYDTTSRNWLQ